MFLMGYCSDMARKNVSKVSRSILVGCKSLIKTCNPSCIFLNLSVSDGTLEVFSYILVSNMIPQTTTLTPLKKFNFKGVYFRNIFYRRVHVLRSLKLALYDLIKLAVSLCISYAKSYFEGYCLAQVWYKHE